MMDVKTFKAYMEIGRKLKRSEPLSAEEEALNVQYPQLPEKEPLPDIGDMFDEPYLAGRVVAAPTFQRPTTLDLGVVTK